MRITTELLRAMIIEGWEQDLEDDMYTELTRMDVGDDWMYDTTAVEELRSRLINIGYAADEVDLVLPHTLELDESEKHDVTKRPDTKEEEAVEVYERFLKLAARLADIDAAEMQKRHGRAATAAHKRGDTAQSFARSLRGRHNRWR